MFAFIRKEFTAGFTPERIPPCVFLQSHLHCAHSEKVKSKAPLLQSTTRFPLHLAGGQGFEVNKTTNETQETQHVSERMSITNKS